MLIGLKVSSLACKYVFYRPELNGKRGLTGIKVRGFFEENIEKKHLCHHDKNYYYFFKSNISVINFIVFSRNMIKVLKHKSL